MTLRLPALVALLAAPGFAAAQTLEPIGRYQTEIFDESAAEIVVYDKRSKRLFVVNGDAKTIDILDFADPTQPTKIGALDMSKAGAAANSVAVHDGLVVAAVEADPKQAPGAAALFKVDGTFITAIEICAHPDMVTITPDGSAALLACEGEPNDDLSNDPEGGVAIVDLSNGAENATATIADFKAFGAERLTNGLRIGRPGATFAQDMEPEYIAVSADSKAAVVTLQENNGVAIVDVANRRIVDVIGLGVKSHAQEGNGLDASNKDGAINIRTWPMLGLYQPDSIVRATIAGVDYYLTANEGDARDYDGFSEEARVKDLTLDPAVFPNAAELQKDENLGRLKTTTTFGDVDGDGDHDRIYSYGARSFSVWSSDGQLVWDSGDQFERITAERLPKNFNSTNDENGSFDDRSDDKGPEPEAIAFGVVDGKPLAFIGLERVGGVMIYDMTTPQAPVFVDFVNTRDYTGDAAAGTAGDLAPEGFTFIAAENSPNGENLLVAAYEVSGSLVVFEIK
ncbi:MAG: choice-of-anchor I family protein [Pseudomonadota bacterium]